MNLEKALQEASDWSTQFGRWNMDVAGYPTAKNPKQIIKEIYEDIDSKVCKNCEYDVKAEWCENDIKRHADLSKNCKFSCGHFKLENK